MTNLERMIALADHFFEAKIDLDQPVVDEADMARPQQIHPATMSEASEENGSIACILLILTTHQMMEGFDRGEIGEDQLLEPETPDSPFKAVYLCLALVLPEHRAKRFARRLALDAARSAPSRRTIPSKTFPFGHPAMRG